MNNLEALCIVRNCATYSPQLQTRQGKAALAVVDRKIQSLLRKKAWRDGGGATPIHMADANFKYPLPDEMDNYDGHVVDIRDKAAQIANNAPEEKERFLGRQIILICEKIFVDRNRTPAAPNHTIGHTEK